MTSSPLKSIFQWLWRHLAWHGVIAFVVAVLTVFALRGIRDPRDFGVFLPIIVAWGITRNDKASPISKSLAWGYLLALGVGAIVSRIPRLFPNLSVDRQFDPHLDRMLAWCFSMVVIWLCGLLPFNVFRGNIPLIQHGEPVEMSMFTRRLGMFTFVLLWVLFLPIAAKKLGFWPVFK